MNEKLMHPADLLVYYMKRIYEYGMTTTSGGNLSILDEAGDMWITPGGTDKGTMTRDDIICVKKDGTIIGKHKPSSEYPFHQKLYRTRKDIRAVLHAHAPAIMAFSVVRKIPDLTMLPATFEKCGKISMAPYGMTGSEDLGDKIAAEFKKGCDIAILENHGLVTAAATMSEAFLRFEALEFGAQIEMNAAIVGEKRLLTEKQLEQKQQIAVFTDAREYGYSSAEKEARKQVCEFLHRAYHQKLICGCWGSVSVRLDETAFVMTPKDIDRKEIQPEQLIHIEGNTIELGNAPDEYAALHQEIYRKHPNINAVIIAQPLNLMAFAVTKTPMNTRLIPESYMVLQDIPKLDFASYYVQPELVAARIDASTPLVLLENDAAVATGVNLLKAFDRLEVAEYSAKAIINASHLGTIIQISDADIEEIKEKFGLK